VSQTDLGEIGTKDHRERHIYGRRKGHALSASQAERLGRLLPGLRIDLSEPPPLPFSKLFQLGQAQSISDIWLEVGFGSGEHLADQAIRHPDTGFIGAEIFVNGLAALVRTIEEKELSTIRLHDGEAQVLVQWLPAASIGRVYILFPDPWPKRRHWKRRLISPPFLDALARVMRPGGELRVATDVGDYARTTLLAVSASPDFEWLARRPGDWRLRPSDEAPTRYEAAALEAGRCCQYFRFVRRPR
jgi:tRNA (guanine-N7-)-methyltransferase